MSYEEGAGYSLLDGGPVNDTLSENTCTIAPEIRDLRIWRFARMFDRFRLEVSMDARTRALGRNAERCRWILPRDHEIIGHGGRWTEDFRRTRDEERERMRMAIRSVERTTGQ